MLEATATCLGVMVKDPKVKALCAGSALLLGTGVAAVSYFLLCVFSIVISYMG